MLIPVNSHYPLVMDFLRFDWSLPRFFFPSFSFSVFAGIFQRQSYKNHMPLMLIQQWHCLMITQRGKIPILIIYSWGNWTILKDCCCVTSTKCYTRIISLFFAKKVSKRLTCIFVQLFQVLSPAVRKKKRLIRRDKRCSGQGLAKIIKSREIITLQKNSPIREREWVHHFEKLKH